MLFIFIYGCVGSSFLCEGFLQLWQAGATPHRGARASHHRGLSRCVAQAPDAQAQQLWLTGPFAPRHAGSSQTRARTRVPCIGRQTLNHCATREALCQILYILLCTCVCVCVCVCVIYLIVGVLARGFYEASKVMQILSHDQSLSLSDSEACTLNYYANWPLRQLGTL